MSFFLLTTLIGLLVSPTPVAGKNSWQPGLNLSETPGRSFQATLARNPGTGDLLVVWTEDGIADMEEIVGRRWHHPTNTWLPRENLSQSEEWERDGGPALAFWQGSGLLVWTRTYATSQGAPASGHDVLWRAWNGVTWSDEQVLYHGDSYLPGSPGTFGLIPVETPDGILLFITWGSGYRTSHYQDGAWSEVSPWIYLDVSLAQVIVDKGGILHAAAYGPNSRQDGYNGYFHDAYYLTSDGETWSQPINLSSIEGVAGDVALAFDSQERLRFFWSDPDSVYSDESLKSAIWERVYDGGDWTPNTVIVGGEADQAINGFSVATDINATLHLAWSEGLLVDGEHTNLNIYYQSDDGTTWGISEQVYNSSDASRYPVLATGIDQISLIWQEIFWVDGPLQDHEVYFSQRGEGLPPPFSIYLPLVHK